MRDHFGLSQDKRVLGELRRHTDSPGQRGTVSALSWTMQS